MTMYRCRKLRDLKSADNDVLLVSEMGFDMLFETPDCASIPRERILPESLEAAI